MDDEDGSVESAGDVAMALVDESESEREWWRPV